MIIDTPDAEYVVVLRARSSARFRPEDGWQLDLGSVPSRGLAAVRVRTYTRWVAHGDNSLPRELVVEVRGHAASLDEAIAKFGTIAQPIATMVAFAANVQVGVLEVHIAYECTTGSTERSFLETFLPDEVGPVSQGRIISQHLVLAALAAFFALKTDGPRISRALRQYELALRYWYLGGEWLALSHLYMAVEALTEAVIRRAIADRCITEEQLADSLSIVTDDPSGRRWQPVLRQRVRENLIFSADSETYKTAKSASDGLEHGFLEFSKITAHALKAADKTFYHVRRTIVELFDLSPTIADELMAIKPKDVQSRRKVVRGRLIGAAANPAYEGELYPSLQWSSSLGSVLHQGSTLHVKETESIVARTHPDITFYLDRFEIHGRIEDGQAPIKLGAEDVLIKPAPEPKSVKMLMAVGPMIERAVASGAETGQSFPYIFAFNLFGQGVAFFESAYALIRDQRPVEALPALRGLAIVASRFEQMSHDADAGVGIAVRMALDAMGELGVDPDVATMHHQEWIKRTESAGITIPGQLANPDSSAIYASLEVEMRLAQSVVDGTYAAAELHFQSSDPEPGFIGFSPQLEPNQFTEMIASACVIAQLDLLKRGARIFSWTINEKEITSLLEEARDLNEASSKSQEST